jgi:hypothetical protein
MYPQQRSTSDDPWFWRPKMGDGTSSITDAREGRSFLDWKYYPNLRMQKLRKISEVDNLANIWTESFKKTSTAKVLDFG